MRSNWESYVARAGNAKRAIDSAAVTDAARSEPADPFIRTQSTWQPAWPLRSWRSRPARRSTGCARTPTRAV
jgi:hypothetical protein